jgi:hypothetical protein
MAAPTIFDEDAGCLVHGAAVANVAGTPDGTYSANEQTLLSDLQAAVNAILAALRSANILAGD